MIGIPSENKNQVNRSREKQDPAASSPKPVLDEHDQLHDRKGDFKPPKQPGGPYDRDGPVRPKRKE